MRTIRYTDALKIEITNAVLPGSGVGGWALLPYLPLPPAFCSVLGAFAAKLLQLSHRIHVAHRASSHGFGEFQF